MKYIAFDIGTKRIGVAVSDESGIIARPLLTLEVGHSLFPKIGEIIEAEKPQLAVFGIPRHQTGEEGLMAEEIREFAKGVECEYNIKVDFEDESGTSIVAEERLKARGMDYMKVKENVDAEAACVILESYLNR
jgi:putative holliday junction resolvase